MDKTPPKMPMQDIGWKRILIFLGIWLLILSFISPLWSNPSEKIPYTKFRDLVTAGKVTSITVNGDAITGKLREPVETAKHDGTAGAPSDRFQTVVPPFGDSDLMPLLEKNNVTVEAETQGRSWMNTLIVVLLPWVLIIGLFYYASKKMSGMGNMGKGVFGFGKSKAKLYRKTDSKVTFDDVAGLSNAKKELQEVVDFLKDPGKFKAIGGILPKGILLMGPPGTGKTLMARAVAGEADVAFYSISGSEFIEVFVGVGASRVRDMFDNAKKDAPCIIFIDEIDSIGRVRGTGLGGGHDEREQTLNQILSEMDGFSPQESVVVMAATNRADILDPALVRPGRFDRQITVDLPQRAARREILEVHSRRVPLEEDVDLDSIAGRTVGFSGADLKNLVNEAALLAARKGKDRVGVIELSEAVDKVMLGIEREDLLNEEEKRMVAYHEAGHALVAKILPGADPLEKVTIIPRGHALGATQQIPSEDRHNYSRSYLLSRIAIMLGGRVAEKVVFEDITSGSGDDLKKATQLARRMVIQWGMSEAVGAVAFRQGEDHPFIGREISEQRDFSEEMAQLVDNEIRRIIGEMEERAEEVVRNNRDRLDLIAQELLDRETISNREIDRLFEEADARRAVPPRIRRAAGA